MTEFNLKTQSYKITNELIVRKILENNTPHQYMFVKNDNKYDYDIEFFKYLLSEKDYSKLRLGFVEIENKSDGGWGWPRISFLKRKIYKWDRDKWSEELIIKDIPIYYLKFNHDFSDCFCANTKNIFKFGNESKRSDGSRCGSFIELPWDDNNIIHGIKNCVNYILNNKI